MKPNLKRASLCTGIVVIALAGALVWQARSHRSSAPDRKPLFYQDSMHPWVKSDRPGKCTVCEMALTPIYDQRSAFAGGDKLVVLSSNSIRVVNVQTEEVKRGGVVKTARVAGTLEANEASKTVVAAPGPCRVQTLAVNYPGVEVHEGQPLMTLFGPELVQKRAYLRSVGMVQSRTNNVGASQGQPDPFSNELLSPRSGVVIERAVYPGQYVAEGEKLLTIVDASTLWFRFDVYEHQAPWLQVGQSIEVRVPALPGRRFPAAISFVEPSLNEATRTLRVRADVNNPMVTVNGREQRLLRFGMYAEASLHVTVPGALAVPRSAVLFPGAAAYVFVEKAEGVYDRRRVKH